MSPVGPWKSTSSIVGVAVPDGTADSRAVELDPFRGAREGILEALQVELPLAEEEVEVALAVA